MEGNGDDESGGNRYVTVSFYWRILGLYTAIMGVGFWLLWDAEAEHRRDAAADHRAIYDKIEAVNNRVNERGSQIDTMQGEVRSELKHMNEDVREARQTLSTVNERLGGKR